MPARGYFQVKVDERAEDEQGAPDREPRIDEQFTRFRKADVLRWFQESPENDAAWVLNRLAETMPHIVFEAVSEKISSPSRATSQRRMSREKQQSSCRSSCDESTRSVGDPIIQFSSSVFYAAEGIDDTMLLDVMRIGNHEGISEVLYETEDDSALNGRSYVATSGKLVFNPGVSLLHIEVPIINNDLWDTTTEFKCHLKPEGLKGAVLGQYLFHTRVKIIDNDHFPTNDFKELNTAQKIAECSKWSLLLGYINMVTNIPKVWQGTMTYISIDIVHNALYLLNLFLSVYLLDFVVDTSCPDSDLLLIRDKRQSLLLLAFIRVAANFIAHVLDKIRVNLHVVGPARSFVQSALLRKLLNYKSIVRERLPPGHVVQAIQRDAADLVDFGYISMLKVCRAFGKMICMISFKLITPFVFGGKLDTKAFLLLAVIPALMVVFIHVREQATSKVLHERNESHSQFTNQITATSVNYHLVIDYSLRNHCEYKFNEKQRRYTNAMKDSLHVMQDNVNFCKWCQSLVVAIWLLHGGLQVISGSLTVGLFVTNMQMFEALGQGFVELYVLTVGMMNTFPALENVTTLMNHPTDVEQRYRLKRAQRARTSDLRATLRHDLNEKGTKGVAVDLMPIVFDFQHPFKFEGKLETLNFKGRVELHQGQLVAVVGSLGCGKATLLRLIAGSVLPTDGNVSPVFVPSHLRIANVADEPLFFGGTLYESLTFGLDEPERDASLERVKSICRRLTRSHIITDHLDSQAEHSWKDIFSVAQCKLLAIARALIHNYEVLCIHKPLARLTHDDAEHVIKALHDHVDRKGLELTSDSAKRRPRTVIVSAATDRAVEEADNVIIVNPFKGIHLIDPESHEERRNTIKMARVSSIQTSSFRL